jgi:hypothetical protein
MLAHISRSWLQAAGTRRLRHTFGTERKVFRFQRRVRFEADTKTAVAQVHHRASSVTDRAPFQPILVEIDGAKMLAVAAVLPLKVKRGPSLTPEIKFSY